MERRYRINTAASAIIAINVLVFLLFNLVKSDLRTYLVMIKPLALSGDFWRFFTSMFAHADITHLALNMLCLYVFGQLTEMFFGTFKFIVIYLLSGIAGTALSIIFSDYSSLGASGAIFGVVAANIYMLTKMNGETKQRFASDLIGFIVINIGFSFFSGGVDIAAHIGGLLGGAVAGFALGHRNERFTKTNALGILRVSGAFILVIGLVFGAFRLKMSKPADYLSAVLLRYEYYNAENAYRLSEQAVSKFPDHVDIREIHQALNYLVKLK